MNVLGSWLNRLFKMEGVPPLSEELHESFKQSLVKIGYGFQITPQEKLALAGQGYMRLSGFQACIEAGLNAPIEGMEDLIALAVDSAAEFSTRDANANGLIGLTLDFFTVCALERVDAIPFYNRMAERVWLSMRVSPLLDARSVNDFFYQNRSLYDPIGSGLEAFPLDKDLPLEWSNLIYNQES